MKDLKEALDDYYCASDAILGKHIDTLASAARSYADLPEKIEVEKIPNAYKDWAEGYNQAFDDILNLLKEGV